VNYQECIDYLISRLPMFQNVGKTAFKKDLTNTYKLLECLGNPHEGMRFIHVAGTNGKGSVSSMLAASLTQQGYKVGLYTSPHLIDFTERIRINGNAISQESVIAFVKKIKNSIDAIQPSFFEVTVAMAFDYFRSENVDISVIEVGLGGRLDSTNVIQPILSLITSIGWDHMDMLGNTIEEIAIEKAGIIKNNTPIICSRFIDSSAIDVIKNKSQSENTTFYLSQSAPNKFKSALSLKGSYQNQNLDTVYTALQLLPKLGFSVSEGNFLKALTRVSELSGLRGRWEKLRDNPVTICDTGHNAEAIPYLFSQLDNEHPERKKHIIWGMVSDKDRGKILELLPKDAEYYLVKPGVIRGYDAKLLADEMQSFQLSCMAYTNFKQALDSATTTALNDDGVIFIGGSTFLVADALPYFH